MAALCAATETRSPGWQGHTQRPRGRTLVERGRHWRSVLRGSPTEPRWANDAAPPRASTATDRVDVIANAVRELALSLEGSTWPVRATCHVTRLRDQRHVPTSAPGLVTSSRQHSTANSRPTSTPLSACGEKRSVTPTAEARYAPKGRPPRRKTPKIEIRGTPHPVFTGNVPVQV